LDWQRIKKLDWQRIKKSDWQRIKKLDWQRIKKLNWQRIKKLDWQRIKKLDWQRIKKLDWQMIKKLDWQRITALRATLPADFTRDFNFLMGNSQTSFGVRGLRTLLYRRCSTAKDFVERNGSEYRPKQQRSLQSSTYGHDNACYPVKTVQSLNCFLSEKLLTI
jgi:hypothetical protein